MDASLRNCVGLTMKEFMSAVDAEIERIVGLSSSDLVDYDYWSAWQDGENPKVIARRVLREEMN